MRYKFTVREILEKDFVVEAPNKAEAENLLEGAWASNDKFMLHEDCMIDAKFLYRGRTDEKADYEYRPTFRILQPDEEPDD